jgi:hypothetical protein
MKLTRTALVAGVALVLSNIAHADSISDYVHLELGGGVSKFATQDGLWFQEGLPHSLHTISPAVKAGLTGPIITRTRWGVDWHVDYVFVGSVSSDAIATTDQNYDLATHSVINPNVVQSRFVGRGNINGVAFTAEPYVNLYGFRFGIDGGPFVFRSTWHDTLYDPRVSTPFNAYASGGLKLGWTYGASISRGPVSLAYEHYSVKVPSETFPPLSSSVNMVSVMYRF